MYIINLEIPALILTILCLLYSLTVKRRQYIIPKGARQIINNQHVIYLFLVVSHILSSFSSIIGVKIQEMANPDLYFFQYFFHALYFFSHATISVMFTLYIMSINGTTVNKGKLFYFLFFLPYLVCGILVLINSFTGCVFYLDKDLIYHRGDLIFIMYGIGAAYLIAGIYFFFKNRNIVSKGDGIATGVIILVAGVGIVVQAIDSRILVELFAEALACVVLMMILEDRAGHIDFETGALNNKAFSEINQILLKSNINYSVILIAINNLDLFTKLYSFKETNHLLYEISKWFTSIASERNIYTYRYGSFALVGVNKTDENNNEKVQLIIDRFNKEWLIEDIGEVRVNATLAVFNIPRDLNSYSELQDYLKMNISKNQRETTVLELKTLKEERTILNIERDLRRVIDENKLMVYYQPIWSVKEQKFIAAEALLRIDDDVFRSYSPEVYIPLAERNGLINHIGSFVFDSVCAFYKNNDLKNKGVEYIELNLSLYQLLDSKLVDNLENIRKKYDIDPSFLNLEITETASLQESNIVKDNVNKLIKLGYNFSLDDFGTGYSNIVRLFGLPFRNIKIDRSLLWSSDDEMMDGVLDSIVMIVNNLGYGIIQEGVETKEQLDKVVNLGCDLIQGFYFSKPISQADYLKFIEENNKND